MLQDIWLIISIQILQFRLEIYRFFYAIKNVNIYYYDGYKFFCTDIFGEKYF